MQFTLGVIFGAVVLSICLWVVGFFDSKHDDQTRVATYTVHLLNDLPQTVRASNAVVGNGLLFLEDTHGEDAGIFNLRHVLFVHVTETIPAS